MRLLFRRLLYIFFIYSTVFQASSVQAEVPEFFTQEQDREYRALLSHFEDLLPQSDLPLLYLPNFRPFSLLDVRALKLSSRKEQRDFLNFNFGVLGVMLLNTEREVIPKLLGLSICQKEACQNERIGLIRAFLAEHYSLITDVNEQKSLYIIQQTSPEVYRLNNTFFTPVELITYLPSEHGGFVPSANYKKDKLPENANDFLALAKSSEALRSAMDEFGISAVVKVNERTINIIFDGLADNHWGVVVEHFEKMPNKGDLNHLGLEYETVEQLSEKSFYYQTN